MRRSSPQRERLLGATLQPVCELALGGTAVGTGQNAHPEFGEPRGAAAGPADGSAAAQRAEQVRRDQPRTTRSSRCTAR